jgi:NADPH-dependent 2,4-dienoyl-CoA reductase/sulfur reductase-like enzyme
MRRLLITGAGKAALACIEQLSKLKHRFSITLLRGPGASTDGEERWDEHLDQQRLNKLGVEVRKGVCVEAIDRYAKVARSCDGSRTTFDTLILAAGSANHGLARAAGLEVRSGVLLNDFLQTSDAHVYALGGGAEHRGTIYVDPETIDEQARVLAAHLAGYIPGPFHGLGTNGMGSSTAAASNSDGLMNLSAAVKTCASLPASSAGFVRRSEVQTLEPEVRPALVGVV